MDGKPDELAFLANEATGLDLTDPEDRAIFRGRVSNRLRMTTVAAMREWVGGTMRDRASAVRAVADAYIASATTPCAVILNVLRVALDRADMSHRATGFKEFEVEAAKAWVSRAAIAKATKEQ